MTVMAINIIFLRGIFLSDAAAIFSVDFTNLLCSLFLTARLRCFYNGSDNHRHTGKQLSLSLGVLIRFCYANPFVFHTGLDRSDRARG